QVWERRWSETKKTITETLAKFDYKGKKIEFTGSAATGWKGVHKGRVRFDAADFDVDSFTIHREDFLAAQKAQANIIGGKVFPNDRAAPRALRDKSREIATALTAALPNVDRVADSSLALKGA
ncbi:MAG TPA: hypothetical protein VGL86_28460, partial [Polyangia bacterium]